MKKLESYLLVVMVLLMLVTFLFGKELSSPFLSGAIVLTMLCILINKFIYEFRSIK